MNKFNVGDNHTLRFFTAFVTGFCQTISINPLDVARTRLMNQSDIKI